MSCGTRRRAAAPAWRLRSTYRRLISTDAPCQPDGAQSARWQTDYHLFQYRPAHGGIAPRPTAFSVLCSQGGRHERERSEEHTSELQSLMRSSYAVFCLKKKKDRNGARHAVYDM